MSLGSRIAKRGKAAVFAHLAAAPREPLLFLYPQWTRNSSTASPASPASPGNSQAQASTHESTVPALPAALGDDPALLHECFNSSKENRSCEQSSVDTDSLVAKARPPNITTEAGIAALEKDQTRNLNVATREATSKNVRRVISLRAVKDHAAASALATRKSYQAGRREELQTWVPDWRKILEALNKHTLQQGAWLSKVLKFELSPSAASKLLHSIDDHFQDISDQYGCSVALGSRDETTKRCTNFVISGPVNAISKCAAEIMRLAPDVQVSAIAKNLPHVPDRLSDGDSVSANGQPQVHASGVKIRYYLDHNRPSAHPPVPADEIPRPTTWTQASLLDYVQAVARPRISKHTNRFTFAKAASHSETVSRIFRDIFKDPECRPAITREACHVALQHHVKFNNIEDARVLFVRMDIWKLRLVPETFNILLSGAAKNNDLHNFHFILHLMLRRGIAPNGRTWAHFIRAILDVRIQLHILSSMQKKGLLNNIDILRETVTHLAVPEIESSLDANQSQATFIAHMDSRYGKDWLTVHAADQIINSLGAHGLISRCWEFLHFMESRFVKPGDYSVNIILHHCKQSSNLTGAVELLRSLPQGVYRHFQANEETFRVLFECAWRVKSYNVAKVVWRYSCLSAATTFRMRDRVFTSMQNSNRVEPPTTSPAKWRKFAGPFIIGLNDISEHPTNGLQAVEDMKALSSDDVEAHDGVVHGDRSQARPEHDSTNVAPSLEGYAGCQTKSFSLSGNSESTTSTAAGGHTRVNTRPSNEESNDPAIEPKPASVKPHHLRPSWAQHLINRQRPQILAPWGPSAVGKRMPYYKNQILKQYFRADIDISKNWESTRPFSEMLVQALKMDTEWKKDENYRNWTLDELLDGRALKVELKSSRSSGREVLFDWR